MNEKESIIAWLKTLSLNEVLEELADDGYKRGYAAASGEYGNALMYSQYIDCEIEEILNRFNKSE